MDNIYQQVIHDGAAPYGYRDPSVLRVIAAIDPEDNQGLAYMAAEVGSTSFAISMSASTARRAASALLAAANAIDQAGGEAPDPDHAAMLRDSVRQEVQS